jgi:hypothetical protein
MRDLTTSHPFASTGLPDSPQLEQQDADAFPPESPYSDDELDALCEAESARMRIDTVSDELPPRAA